MRKAVFAVIVLALIAGGVYAWYLAQESDNGPLILYGNVDVRDLSIGFRQGGRVADILVDEGDSVTSGALIAELDPVPLRNAADAARAEVAKARASLAKLEAGSRPQEVEQAREAELQAQAVFSSRQLEFKRQRELSQSGATSQQALDRARYALDEARARLAEVRATLSLLEEGPRVEDIDAARAQLEAAQAQAAQAETAMSDARLTAPADAVVLMRIIEPGAIVQAGSPVLSLALRDPVYVRAYVSETDLGVVAPGTGVLVSTDSSARQYHGQIGFVSPRAEFTPKTVQTESLRTELVYRLRIVVDDADEHLLQGMPVTVRLAQP